MSASAFYELLRLAALNAAVAVVYMHVLAYEVPFTRWFGWGEKWLGRTWLYKPFFACEKCFAGQLALWGYLWMHRHGGYHPAHHIAYICVSILAAMALRHVLTWKLRNLK